MLATIEEDALRPEVVTAALSEALARLSVPQAQREAERERLLEALRRLERELGRLTEAVVSGGNLPTLVAAIGEREAQRSRVQHDLAELDQPDGIRGLDLPRIEQTLKAKLADCRGVLSRNVTQARQALRSLVPDRLTFIAQAR